MTELRERILALIDQGKTYSQTAKELRLTSVGVVSRAVMNRKNPPKGSTRAVIYHPTHIGLDTDMLKRIVLVQKELGTSRSETIRTILEWGLDTIDAEAT